MHTVLVQTVTFLLRPATSYRALELGVEPAWLGAARFFLGALARRFGRERLLVGSMALSAVAVAVLPLPMPVALLGTATRAQAPGLCFSRIAREG